MLEGIVIVLLTQHCVFIPVFNIKISYIYDYFICFYNNLRLINCYITVLSFLYLHFYIQIVNLSSLLTILQSFITTSIDYWTQSLTTQMATSQVMQFLFLHVQLIARLLKDFQVLRALYYVNLSLDTL